MTESNSLFSSKEVQSTFVQIQDEVTKLETILYKLQQNKYEVLQNQLSICSFNLATLANSINSLSKQIEYEIYNFNQNMAEFETIHGTIKSISGLTSQELSRKIIEKFLTDSNIWEMIPVDISVPIVVKKESQFYLSKKIINLKYENKQNQEFNKYKNLIFNKIK